MNHVRHWITLLGLGLLISVSASAQDLQERLIKFGHLHNADHPTSLGTKRFAKPVTDRLAAAYDPLMVKLYNDELARVRK